MHNKLDFMWQEVPGLKSILNYNSDRHSLKGIICVSIFCRILIPQDLYFSEIFPFPSFCPPIVSGVLTRFGSDGIIKVS